MGALSYQLFHSVKNRLLRMLKKPLGLILVLLLAGSMIFLSLDSAATHDPGDSPFEAYTGIAVLALCFLFTYLNLARGLSTGTTFFSMADVNLLFSSPVAPQKILVYGIVKQLGTAALTTLVLFFQIPNLINFFNMPARGIAALLLSWFLMMFTCQTGALWLYSFASGRPHLRSPLRWALNGLCILAAALAFLPMAHGLSAGEALSLSGSSLLLDLFPIAGWAKGITTAMIAQNYLLAALFFGLLLLFNLVAVFFIRRQGSDYYEDVLLSTEQRFAVQSAAREGRVLDVSKTKTGRSGIGHGRGAPVLFFRQLTEQRRRGLLFLDSKTLLFVAASIAMALFLGAVADSRAALYTALGFSCYLLMFLGAQSSSVDMLKPYLYLIPESSLKKLLCLCLFGAVKAGIDGLLLFGILDVIYGYPIWEMLCATALCPLMSAMYYSGSLLAQRLLGENHSKSMAMLLYFGTELVMLLLSISAFVTGALLLPGTVLPYGMAAAAMALITFLVLLLCRGLLHDMEAC